MTKASSTHEHLSQEDVVTVGSERAFGVVFAVVFAVVAAWPLKDGGDIRVWAAIVSGLFLAVTFLVPSLLRPLNIVWFKFGLLLHKIVNPLIMGFLFFLTITPIALLMRLFGKDPLHRKFDADAESYWIERSPPGPAPETMKNQF